MRTPEAPWPVAPRPFPDEAFGGWFGRLAGRYRMTVDELARIAQLRLDLGQEYGGWLSAPLPRHDDLLRLCRLCRLQPSTLLALGEATATSSGPKRVDFGYCHNCLFLNPQDVTAPYWKAPWLLGQALPCPKHGSYDHVTGATLARERNLNKLLKFISRRRSWLERRDSRSIGTGCASTVCGHH